MKWHPTEKGFYPKNEWLLVVVRNMIPDEKFPHYFDRFISIGKWSSDKWVLRDVLVPHSIEITHWARLPAYPKDSFSQRLRSWLFEVLTVKSNKKLPPFKGKTTRITDQVR